MFRFDNLDSAIVESSVASSCTNRNSADVFIKFDESY